MSVFLGLFSLFIVTLLPGSLPSESVHCHQDTSYYIKVGIDLTYEGITTPCSKIHDNLSISGW